jgi:Effector Associated Constant Component 1
MFSTEVHIIEGENTFEELTSLQDWIRNQKINGLRIELANPPTSDESMGSLSSAISLYHTSKDTLKQTFQSIDAWSKNRNPKIQVKMKNLKSGFEIEINAENISNLETVIDRFLEKLNE